MMLLKLLFVRNNIEVFFLPKRKFAIATIEGLVISALLLYLDYKFGIRKFLSVQEHPGALDIIYELVWYVYCIVIFLFIMSAVQMFFASILGGFDVFATKKQKKLGKEYFRDNFELMTRTGKWELIIRDGNGEALIETAYDDLSFARSMGDQLCAEYPGFTYEINEKG